jgi:hypothetical protein
MIPTSSCPLVGWMSGSWTQNWTRFGWRPPWSGVSGPCPFSFVPWHLLYNWGKARKTSVWVAEQCWVLHIASTWPPCGGGLDWPAVHLSTSVDREGLRTALGRRRCLPSCRTKGFPAWDNFESKLSVNALMWLACRFWWTSHFSC